MTYDLAIDYDGTLVDVRTKQWFPPALGALQTIIRRGYSVVVHTCRAGWPEGLAEVREGLESVGLAGLDVWTDAGKPHAKLFYVDNQSFPPFTGDWDALLSQLPAKPPAFAQAKRRPEMWH